MALALVATELAAVSIGAEVARSMPLRVLAAAVDGVSGGLRLCTQNFATSTLPLPNFDGPVRKELAGLGESHVHHELAFRRMTRNMPLAGRILRQHDTPRGETADVAIARLKFDLAS